VVFWEDGRLRRARRIDMTPTALAPKFKTQVVFNEPGDDGRSPFHLYSMRQAIEEGFIMDVWPTIRPTSRILA
jgi:hypothetical protein